MSDWLYRWCYAIADGIKKTWRHKGWLGVLFCLFVGLLAVNFSQGELKPQTSWAWVDIIGEGSSSLCVVIWLFLVLSMRPPGQVTNWFAVGFIGIFASNFQDFLDEWVHLPSTTLWDSWVESLPIGLLSLTMALWLWRKEQRQIERYLVKRQAIYQDVSGLDETTSLPKHDHLNAQLERVFAQSIDRWEKHALLLFDITPFADISYRYGGREADRFLVIISEFILLSLREHDVLCHLAGGRFAIVLKNLDQIQAQDIALELQEQINHFRYRISEAGNSVNQSLAVQASMVMVMAEKEKDSPQSILSRATLALSQQNNAVFSKAFG